MTTKHLIRTIKVADVLIEIKLREMNKRGEKMVNSFDRLADEVETDLFLLFPRKDGIDLLRLNYHVFREEIKNRIADVYIGVR